MTLPPSAPTPAAAVGLDILDDTPRDFRLTERYQHLVQNHVVQDGMTGSPQSGGKPLRQAAISLNQFSKSPDAQGFQRSPYFNATRPTRSFRRILRSVAFIAELKIGAAQRHRVAKMVGFAHKSKS